MRFSEALPSVLRPNPSPQVRHDTHAWLPAANLNIPPLQVAHTMSLTSVAEATRPMPAAHGALTLVHVSSLSFDEKETPAVQDLHSRSAMAVPSDHRPVLAGHVFQSLHAPLPEEVLKPPCTHLEHVRSLDVVSALSMKCPATQGSLTGWQASPLSSVEKVPCSTHPPHVLSEITDPVYVSPWPTAQVRQVAQASLPAAALNCPAAHVAQVRSLLAVGALSRNLPAAHGALTAAQTLPSFAVENVAPTTQAAHARSAISEPACDSPAPMAHFFHGLHAWLPETDLNVPDAQVLHWRSDEAPNAVVSY